MTDKVMAGLEHLASVRASLEATGLDVVLYDEVRVEPTDKSFLAATKFARECGAEAFVSLGGGEPVPGPLKPHIACPTTSGTGSECTGIAIFDLLSIKTKTGIVSRHLRPTMALVDPDCTATLPRNVVAASGFDVLSHALESYTALAHSKRAPAARPHLRPMSQGANPWSDMGCKEALKLLGRHLVRAVEDAGDREARGQVMWAATLAGIAFGNAGVHAPHGMSYAVAGLVRDFHPEGYPDNGAIVAHGISVMVNAPSVFRFTAGACPERHLLDNAPCTIGRDQPGELFRDALSYW